MKALLHPNSSGKSFSITLVPESDGEKDSLTLITSGQYTFQFSGYRYMEPSFRFNGYIPSRSVD